MTLLNIVFPTLSIGIKGTDSLDMKHMLPQNPPRSCAPALDPFMGTDCHLLVISNATANHTDLLISHWGANLNSPQPHVKHLRSSLEINSNRRYLATYSPVTGRLGSFAGPSPHWHSEEPGFSNYPVLFSEEESVKHRGRSRLTERCIEFNTSFEWLISTASSREDFCGHLCNKITVWFSVFIFSS